MCGLLLRSYYTIYRWHLLGIGQTKIIYYNVPDTTGNNGKKFNFIEYVPILSTPAYYKFFLLFSTVIFIFIEFDDLTHFQK